MKTVDDRTMFGKAYLLLQVNMPFLYTKMVKVIMKLIIRKGSDWY